MERRAVWVLGIVFGGLFVCLFGFLFLMYLAVQGGSGRGGSLAAGDRVGVVEIVGPISDAKKTLEALKEFEEARHVKALVIRIDSPGGGVAPSQEIFEAIQRVRAKKHVIASMGSLAASGGYYVAAPAEKIYANPGTLTGSIGVIMQTPNVEGLLKWAGVSMTTVTAGKMKDIGSPFRQMTQDERAYLESVLSDVHEQFIAAVAEGRGMTAEQVRPYADGRIFTGQQALEWKLVDALGGLEDAVAEAGKLGGIRGTPEVEYPRKERRFLEELLGEEASTLVGQTAARLTDRLGAPVLEYRVPMGTP